MVTAEKSSRGKEALSGCVDGIVTNNLCTFKIKILQGT